MSLDDVRRRIEALNRGPLPDHDSAKPVPPVEGHGRASQNPDALARREPRPTLEQSIKGDELKLASGCCYRVSRRLSRCWMGEPAIGHRVGETVLRARDRIDELDAGLTDLIEAGPETLLFMDTETCGFAGTPVFLIGTMWLAQDDLHVEQLLARNYEEEAAILDRFAALCRQKRSLVTFNGKSFDWPFLQDRAAVARIDLPLPELHCDLLHVCRRKYRSSLPDCKLQTLETHVLSRRRVGDIPGSEIPGAYHDFVQTGDARTMREVVHHNFLDLVSMAELVVEVL